MPSRDGQPVKGEDWIDWEIDASVAAYARMLSFELRGQTYSKAESVRALLGLLNARSGSSIERKLQNISAVLDEAGLAWIEGYKPLAHYQRRLAQTVLAEIGPQTQIAESLATYAESALPSAQSRPLSTLDVVVPPPRSGKRGSRTGVQLTGGNLTALDDFRRRRLGAAGEGWVVELERTELARLGRDDLAMAVSWVARDVGDGAGYDVSSFWPDGRERLIEVKTTNFGAMTPFYITQHEVDVSRDRAGAYSLYRVHGFNRDPRIYILDGSIAERARLEPKVFLGRPI